jgi:anti-sigma regulatory factor (Ser/Thr protein kinase)
MIAYRCMCYERHFSDLGAALDEVQMHFWQKIEAPSTNGSADAFCRLQLAVHEWIGNLVRHAHFGKRQPDLHVRIWEQESRLRCVVEDNSDGFDLDTQVEVQRQVLAQTRRLPDDGMGLLLLKAGTDHAEYDTPEGRANRLSIAVALAEHAKRND